VAGIKMKKKLSGMYTRIRPAAPHTVYFFTQHQGNVFVHDLLNTDTSGLNLPAMKVRTQICYFKKIPVFHD
jgi:hypothetical protein